MNKFNRGSSEISNRDIFEMVVFIKEDITSLREEVKELIEVSKEEVLAELRPIARAVDKDALTSINHEKRISRLEKVAAK